MERADLIEKYEEILNGLYCLQNEIEDLREKQEEAMDEAENNDDTALFGEEAQELLTYTRERVEAAIDSMETITGELCAD